ncbi:MAG: BACON domain-containing protein [Bacteroidales bacterium]|nr:BACON domain-containing protein [Bacteroidales bacterium]
MSKRFLLFTIPLLVAVFSCVPKEDPTDKGDDEKPELKVNKEQINAPAQGTEDSFTITSNCYWDITVSDPDGKAVTWVSVSDLSGQGNKDIALSVSANKKTEARTAVIKINAPSSAELGKTITVLQEAGEQAVAEGYGFPIIETFEIDSPESRKLTNAVIGGNECIFNGGMVLSRSNSEGSLEFVCPSHTQPSAGDDADRSVHRSIRMDGFAQGESVIISAPVKDALSGELRLMLGARAASFTKAGWSYYWGADGENWNKIEIENAITPGSDAVWNIIYFNIPDSNAIPAGGTIYFKITAEAKPSKDYISISNTICVCPAKGETGNVPAMDGNTIAFSTAFNDLVDSYAADMRYQMGWLRTATNSYASNMTSFNDQYVLPDELSPFASVKGCYERPGYLQVGYYDESLWTRICAGSFIIKIGECLKQMGVAATDARITLKACNMKDFRGYESVARATIAAGEESYVMEGLKDGVFSEYTTEFHNLTQESVITVFAPQLTDEEKEALGRGEKVNNLLDYRFFIDDVVVELTAIHEKGSDTNNGNEGFDNGGNYNW